MRRARTETRTALFLSWMLVSGLAEARRPSELGLPTRVEVQGKKLYLNGASIQKKLWFEIYGVGLYVETPTRSANAALAADETKRIHLRLLRDASSSQLRD